MRLHSKVQTSIQSRGHYMQTKLHLGEPMPLKALGGAEHERRTHAVAPTYVALLDFGRLACLSSRFVHGAADSSTALTCAQQPSCVRNTLSELCRYRLLQTSPSRLTFEPKRVNAPVSHSVLRSEQSTAVSMQVPALHSPSVQRSSSSLHSPSRLICTHACSD